MLVFQLSPLPARHGRRGPSLKGAVVELDERLLDNDRSARHREHRRLVGAREGRDPDFLHVLQPRREGARLSRAQLGEVRIAASNQETFGVGGRLPMAHQCDHGSNRRPHSAQSMNVSGGWAR